MNPTQTVLCDVATERERQDAKWGEQNHPDGSGPWKRHDGGEMRREEIVGEVRRQHASDARNACDEAARYERITWVHILREEVAEAIAEEDPDLLRRELVQVAAVAVNWIEAIDRRRSRAREAEVMRALLAPAAASPHPKEEPVLASFPALAASAEKEGR